MSSILRNSISFSVAPKVTSIKQALLAAVVIATASSAAVAQQDEFREDTIHQVAAGDWKGAKLADGQPDVQGHWSNTIGNHNDFTGTARSPSRVTNPADGHVPFQDWARVKAEDFAAHLENPIRPEYVEPFARCAPGGPSKSFMWHGYEIRQYPDYVVFLFDSGTRVIHLDGKPALPETVKLWNGDSRGHWEGNTLVVDVNNVNGKARFGRSGEFVSADADIKERYTFDNEGEYFLYEAVYTDPSVLTAPMTVSIASKRITTETETDGWNNITFPVSFADPQHAPDIEAWERTCVENNGNHGDVAVEE
ncbi:MAG: hypothetical protein V4628_16565 [Pseudomonadota bacterium]